MNKRIRAVAAIGLVGTAFVFAACGGSKNASSSSSENTFELSEFQITPPKDALPSGRVTITADNVGGEVHELVIVRAAKADGLPTKADGSVDEDKIAAADKVGDIKDVAAGTNKSKAFELSAGTYVALCNLIDEMAGSGTTMGGMSMDDGSATTVPGAGHVHFAEGMHATFTVS
jgi:hypothetical protein